MKASYWIIAIIILLLAGILVILYFPQFKDKCEFGKSSDNCNAGCEIDSDCQFQIGYCVNINENVFLPEGMMPMYEILVCRCENNRCVGNSTGRIAI